MKYPYFRGLEADRYSFYRVPKALIKVDLFEKMSGDAKLLYAVLLDRMNLSLKNGWQDENGNAYIICTIDEIMDSIRCARQKAVKLLDELEHEYQLIERRRQGLGKPNLLYVKDLYAGLSQSNYWKYENQTSGGLKSELPGVWKSNGSKTDAFVLFLYNIIVPAEYYKKKTTYIMLGTMAATVINLVTNYIFITKFGYIAAAYTTLFSYICYLVLHIIISHRVIGFYVLSIKDLLIHSGIICGMAALDLIFINHLLIRWGACAVVVILLMGYLLYKTGIYKKIATRR